MATPESIVPFTGPDFPQNYSLSASLTYQWDVSTLTWIKGKQPVIDGGVVVAGIADGGDVAEGATTDSAVTSDTTGTVSGKLRGLIKWAFERMPASLGQTTMASSLPVTLASDQSNVNATLYGTDDAGTLLPLPVTPEGHLEVAVHAPRLPFGSMHAEKLSVVFQSDAVYGLNPLEMIATTGNAAGGSITGTATAANNKFVASTGTAAYSFGTVQSRPRLRYRPGQGVVGRFAGYFTSPVASSIQVLGFGTAESGFYWGYNGTSFGILYVTGGVRAIRTLTVTTASTATNDYQIVLNSAAAVNVTATNSGSTVKTAYEISKGTYPGWSASQIGSTVVFLANDVGVKGGTYSLAQSGAGVPAAGSFASTLAGVASTDTWIPQASWNGDPLDGNGPSGFTLNPLTGNVFQLNVQYLGFGTISFDVEVPATNGNNASFVTCHTINYPNTATSTNVSQPSFPFTMAAYSAGSTTDIAVYASSVAGFVEGDIQLTGPRFSYSANSTAVSTGSYYCLFTVKNNTVYKSRANQAVVNLVSWGACHDDATPVTMFLIRNATLVGTPNFTAWSTNSCTSIDTAATTCTVSDNSQLLKQLSVGQNGSVLVQFNDRITLQPGETITLAAQTVTGTATYTLQNLDTREDQ